MQCGLINPIPQTFTIIRIVELFERIAGVVRRQKNAAVTNYMYIENANRRHHTKSIRKLAAENGVNREHSSRHSSKIYNGEALKNLVCPIFTASRQTDTIKF